MAGASSHYTSEIRKALGYSATWLPNVEVRIGDVGDLRGHQYQRVTTLADLGIDFKVRRSKGKAVMQHSTTDSVSIEIGGKSGSSSQLSPLAEGSIRVEFHTANAVLFQAGNCQ